MNLVHLYREFLINHFKYTHTQTYYMYLSLVKGISSVTRKRLQFVMTFLLGATSLPLGLPSPWLWDLGVMENPQLSADSQTSLHESGVKGEQGTS